MYDNVKMVMGWDIGDGTTICYAQEATPGSKRFPLYLHEQRDESEIFSIFSKREDGRIVIGQDAAKQKGCVSNFKKSPKEWENKDGSGRTYKEQMSDFIRGVSKTILKNNSNRERLWEAIQFKKDEDDYYWNADACLLVVGCPASEEWKSPDNRQKYEKLIREATGINHVIVVEESRAAIFSLFHNENIEGNIDLQKGVLVDDLGSSTADASCIIPGGKSVHLSWNLGASSIEKSMLDYVAEDETNQEMIEYFENKYKKTKIILGTGNAGNAIINMRGCKEDYYSGTSDPSTPKTVSLVMQDENGVELKKEDGNAAMLSVNYSVNDELINYAAYKKEQTIYKDFRIVSKGSWENNCRDFMEATKLLLKQNDINPAYVVITGGASRMAFVVDIAKEVYGKNTQVITSQIPSHSVVIGLTTIAYNELHEDDVRETIETTVSEGTKDNIEKMIDSIADILSRGAYDAAVQKLDNCSRTTATNPFGETIEILFDWNQNIGDIKDWTEDSIQSYLDSHTADIVNNKLEELDSSNKKMIADKINEAAESLYSDKAFVEFIKISAEDVKVLGNNMELHNVALPNIAQDANIIGTILGIILSLVLGVVLFIIALELPALSGVLALIGFLGGVAITDTIQKQRWVPVPLGALRKAVRKMENQRYNNLIAIKNSIKEKIKEALEEQSVYGNNYEKMQNEMTQIANIVFDRILLKETDNKFSNTSRRDVKCLQKRETAKQINRETFERIMKLLMS